MRWFNILLGSAIFVGALYLSYWHTYDLLYRATYSGHMAHIGTMIGEAVFALGAVNIFFSKDKVGWREPPRIAFYTGVAIVFYSNVSSGFNKGAEAIGVGVAIPLLMLIAEWVVSDALIKVRRAEAAKKEAPETHMEPLELQRSSSVEQVTPQVEESPLEEPTVEEKPKAGERYESIKQAFEQFIEENGERPGRTRLSRAANCSLTEAQKFLTRLKEQQTT